MLFIQMSITQNHHHRSIIIWTTSCKLCASSVSLKNQLVSPCLFSSAHLNSGQVFHELARHLQTRRLIAGDSISLDQDRNFYCVIDGTVQVFARTAQTTLQNGSWDDEDMNGYQLINEVRSGGTLSSLFSILSLFTDEIKLSWQEDARYMPSANSAMHLTLQQKHVGRINTDVSHLDLESEQSSPTPLSRNRTASVSSSGSTAHPAGSVPGTTDGRQPHSPSNVPSPLRSDSIQQSLRHGIVGRATEDSTLAVIPAEAFRRVTKKFPKATGHIVQGRDRQSMIHPEITSL